MPTLRCPFRVLTSHGRNSLGFKALQEYRISGECHLPAIQCLGLQLDGFVVTAQPDNRYLLEAAAPSLTEQEVLNFLDRLEVALTAHFGAAARNAHYGTPYVEFDRFNLQLVEDAPSTTVTASAQLSMQAIEYCLLSSDAVASLAFNPLRQLYADGLRATTAEAKFFHWFIILEEFLEKSDTLSSGFTALFSDQDKAQVRSLADTLGDSRKKGVLVGVLTQTLEARREKLAVMLSHLGISTVTSPSGYIAITPERCGELIAQRNQLFHRGAHIDETLLYQVLFPIVTRLAACSDVILALR
jgi:hypothetical protein